MHDRYSSNKLTQRACVAPRNRNGMSVKFRKLAFVIVIINVGGCVACKPAKPDPGLLDSCALALASHSGNDPIDREIVRLQETARAARDQSRVIEQLGWAYVQKSRLSYDPGFYKLAEQCAICIDSQNPNNPEAMLLHGHVLYNLHRFNLAEAIARRLVGVRGAPFDFGLLGDALMEQGRLNDAVNAYQKMIDLKPGPQAYVRVAHIRWLKGDLAGALEMMQKATKTISTRDAESAAWAYTRVASYELQAGSWKNAERACEAALQLKKDYPPALMARGRLLLAQNQPAESIRLLRQAARLNPLPEYEWFLADALNAAGRSDEARVVEDGLKQKAALEDPRTLSLFLATRREQPDTALKLAEQETRNRADVFTLDALAWALAAAGRVAEARESIQRALAEGTRDARLFYHAGSIAAMSGRADEARLMLNKAAAIRQMLFPSEQEGLLKALAEL